MLTIKSKDGEDFNLLMELLRGEHWHYIKIENNINYIVNCVKRKKNIYIRNFKLNWKICYMM